MNHGTRNDPSVLEALSPAEQERVDRANEFYTRIFSERGVRVSSWHDFGAWKEYVDGRIGESELDEKAKTELEDVSQQFGKYVVIREEPPDYLKEGTVERERAKLAHKIYRKVCKDAGLTLCFFNDFKTWSDYVRGVIGESEFYEKAKIEVESIIARTEQEAAENGKRGLF